MKKLLLLIFGLLIALPGIARDFTYKYKGQTITYTVISEEDKTCRTKERFYYNYFNETSGNLELPAYASDGINKYKLIEIGYESFYHNEWESIIIPSTVSSIGKYAFVGCNRLKTLTFYSINPPTLLENYHDGIGSYIPSRIDFSIEIYVPNESIDEYSNFFYNNDGIDIYVLSAPERTFSYTYEGKTINYIIISDEDKTCKTKDGYFSNPGNNISGKLVIPTIAYDDDVDYIVTSISDYSFSNNGLTQVTIPNSVTSIGNYAFYDCNGLTAVTIGSSVTSIGEYAFCNCIGLTEITIPNSVISIGHRTFEHCSGLTVATIGSSVTSIGNYAFYDCDGLTEITIPNSVDSIGEGAFSSCSKLTTVSLPVSTKRISNSMFSYCTALTKIEGISNVSTIGESAFYGCTNLRKFLFSDKLIEIEESAFNGASLTSVLLPKSIQSIGVSAFRNDSYHELKKGAYPATIANPFNYGTASVEYPVDAEIINDCIFDSKHTTLYYVDLSFNGELEIPEGVTEIGKNALTYCNIASVKLPLSLETIGYAAFRESNIEEVIIPDNVRHLDTQIFYNCKNLISITISEGVDCAIPSSFCYECNNLRYIYIGNSVTSIGDRAFYKCSGADLLYIGTSITSIGDYAFSYNAIETLIIPNNVETLGINSFEYCINLKTVIIGNSLKKTGISSFYKCRKFDTLIGGRGLEELSHNSFKSSIYPTYRYGYFTALTPPVRAWPVGDDTAHHFPPSYVQNESLIDIYASKWQCNAQSINVMVEPTEILCNTTEISGKPGDKIQLNAMIMPENVTLPQIMWTSTNPKVATVSQDGVVTILKIRNDEIGLDELDNTIVNRSCKIIGETLYNDAPILEITVNFSKGAQQILWDQDFSNIQIGDCIELSAVSTSGLPIIYDTSDHDIAVIEGNTIKFLSYGKVVITASQMGDINYKEAESINQSIDVLPIFVENLSLDKEALILKVEDIDTRTASITPDNASNKNVTWNSADDKIAIVDENGDVTAVYPGETIITVTAADGSGISASCKVTVLMPELGDSNGNGSINIADAVNTANYAVGNPVEHFYFEAADVNQDGYVTLADASATVSIILAQSVAVSEDMPHLLAMNPNPAGDCLRIDDFSVEKGETANISIKLDNSENYVALQADIVLPEGLTLESLNAGMGVMNHTLSIRQMDNNRVRIVLFDLANNAFSHNEGSLIDLIVKANNSSAGDIFADNIIASDAEGNEYDIKSVGGHNEQTSDIDGLTSDDIQVKVMSGSIHVYNAQGLEIAIYSVGGEMHTRFIADKDDEYYNAVPGAYIVTVDNRAIKVMVK